MTLYTPIFVSVSDAFKAKANTISYGMGWQPIDGDSFQIPAALTEKGAPQRWYCHSQASPVALSLIQDMPANNWPAAPWIGGTWADLGVSKSDMTALAADISLDVKTEQELKTAGKDYGQQIADKIAAAGLVKKEDAASGAIIEGTEVKK